MLVFVFIENQEIPTTQLLKPISSTTTLVINNSLSRQQSEPFRKKKVSINENNSIQKCNKKKIPKNKSKK